MPLDYKDEPGYVPHRALTKEEYYRWRSLGVTCLAHKYAYYIMGEMLIGDGEYDTLEKEYVAYGKSIGKNRLLFWVGFDKAHPWAKEAKRAYKDLKKKHGSYS